VLYVGKATNLRSRVRSYFSGDTRRKVGQLLRETHAIDHIVCPSPLDAAVREVRLIHELQPRFNRQAKTWSKYAYLKLTLDEAFPRLSVVRVTRDDGAFYLGPLPSTTFAKRVAEAIESVVPLRRCTTRITPRSKSREGPCAPAQLGVSTCPCAGAIGVEAYADIVARTVRGLTGDPELLLSPLRERMYELAASDRFEEAADVRDRAAALAQALRRQRRLDAVRRSGRLEIQIAGQGGARFVDGRLVQAWAGDDLPLPLDSEGGARGERVDADTAASAGAGTPVERELADELFCVASWLDANAGAVRVVHCDGGLCSTLPRVASFEPQRASVPAAVPRRADALLPTSRR
jgi:DNA polymerase-3 subunit epsilon